MRKIFSLIIWIQILCTTFGKIASNPLRGYHGAPIIHLYDSVVINVNEDKTIECKGKEPVTWVSETINKNPNSVNINKFVNHDGSEDTIIFSDHKYIYHSDLELKSVTVDLVGYYYCIYESLLSSNEIDYEKAVIEYNASSIYVFVNDTENLLYNPEHFMVLGEQYSPFVIPCKPTSPNVKVELIKDGEEVKTNFSTKVGFRLVENEIDYGAFICTGILGEKKQNVEFIYEIKRTYDPKIGFTVSFSHIGDSGYYECIVQDDPDQRIELHVVVNEKSTTTIYPTSTTNFSRVKFHNGSINSFAGEGKSKGKMQALTSYVKKPIIISDSHFAKNGVEFTLSCHVEMTSDAPYGIKFYLPSGALAETNDFLTLSQIEHEHLDKRKSHINLTIHSALDSRDQGDYTCMLIDYHNNSNSAITSITFVDKPIVQLNASNPKIDTRKGKKSSIFHLNYLAYPKAMFEWFNPKNEKIATDEAVMDRSKYKVVINKDDIEFTIKFPEIEDYGEYRLVAYSGGESFEKKVQLIVSEKPTCTMEDVYVMQGEEIHMTCECLAYPPAEITWSFIPCLNPSLWPECREPRKSNRDEDNEQSQNETQSSQQADYHQFSEIKFTASQPGTVKCKAKNKLGDDRIERTVQIVDLASPLIINGIEDENKIAIGDELKLECGAIVYNFTDKIEWLKNGEPVKGRNDLHIIENGTKFSYRKSLKFDEIRKDDNGEYRCEVFDRNQVSHTVLTNVNLHNAQSPIITTNFNQSELSIAFGTSLNLECYVTGLPIPTLTWYKNNEPFVVNESDSRVSFINNGVTLVFTVLKPEDEGKYECVAENRISREVKEIYLSIIAPSGQLSKAIIISVASIIVLLVLLSLYLCLKVQRKKKLIAELKAAGLANFEEGNIESIDPEVNLDEQADLLPYDKRFEFPREKLKLGKQLGAGAFGVVVKAVAQGIVHYEEETTVAVKMVKKQTDNEVMKALVSELKIMIHLGQHLNVVNLLGAVTKNIAKRELMVIVEYCQFGNLQSFLVKHRPYFIDQVRNDKIDTMIMKNEMRWSKNSAYNSYNSQGLKYISVAFANDKIKPKEHSYININGNRYINYSEGNHYNVGPTPMGLANPGNHMTSQGYVRHSGFQQIDSCNTEATVVSAATDGEESALLSNNSDQPPWRSNYGMDYKGPTRSVCTSDLVCWAFQVARGMEYLSSRKVLHGDLAARNILLCEDNIVKICDFGLSKSMYKNDNYKRKGEAPLPFKWLSLEAISDHVFSVYSDIWSFGVVLWEFFTLGKVPYTGMEANQELFYKLRDGYRMEKPKYATQDIYDIMLNCWNAKPESRPLFKELEKKLSAFMMDSVKDHYLDLNEPYMQANNDIYQKGAHDYLTTISIPDGEAPMPPLAQEESFYVNNSAPDVNAPSTPDYLSMSPQSGVVKYNSFKPDYLRPDSPTITKNLDTSPKNKKNVNKKPELPEEIPMLLHNQNGLPTVDDIEAQNSYTDMSFPSHKNNDQTDAEYNNVFATNENYVNIPNKNSSIANPTYIALQSARNHNH